MRYSGKLVDGELCSESCDKLVRYGVSTSDLAASGVFGMAVRKLVMSATCGIVRWRSDSRVTAFQSLGLAVVGLVAGRTWVWMLGYPEVSL